MDELFRRCCNNGARYPVRKLDLIARKINIRCRCPIATRKRKGNICSAVYYTTPVLHTRCTCRCSAVLTRVLCIPTCSLLPVVQVHSCCTINYKNKKKTQNTYCSLIDYNGEERAGFVAGGHYFNSFSSCISAEKGQVLVDDRMWPGVDSASANQKDPI